MRNDSAKIKIITAIIALIVNTALVTPVSNLLKSSLGLDVFAQLYQPYVALPISYTLFVIEWRTFTNILGTKLYLTPALTLLFLSPVAWFIYIVAGLAIH